MHFAHIFTGLGSDFRTIKKAVRPTWQKETAVKHVSVNVHRSPASSSVSSPTAEANCIQQRLRDAEDNRWEQVECGSPLRFRSCVACSFLSAASETSCEVCGAPVPVLDPCEHNGDNTTCQDFTSNESRDVASLGENVGQREGRKRSLEEVVVADEARVLANGRNVERHNLAIAVFRALDRRGLGTLRPEDFQRFAQLLRLANSHDTHSWAQVYVDLADEYGWDALHGATLMDFIMCIDNAKSSVYASDQALWTLLARLDRQDGLSGSCSHTAVALCLGQAPLELDLEQERCSAQLDQNSRKNLVSGEDSDASGESAEDSEDNSSNDSDDGEVREQFAQDSDGSSSDGVPVHDTLDVAAPVGTQVEVFYDDDVWYPARVTSARGIKATVLYNDGFTEELDMSKMWVRLAGSAIRDETSEVDDTENSEVDMEQAESEDGEPYIEDDSDADGSDAVKMDDVDGV